MKQIPFLARFWHSLVMSASVILVLRFKREWIQKYESKFLLLIISGWVTGILIYIGFIMGIRGEKFSFLRSIFQF